MIEKRRRNTRIYLLEKVRIQRKEAISLFEKGKEMRSPREVMVKDDRRVPVCFGGGIVCGWNGSCSRIDSAQSAE